VPVEEPSTASSADVAYKGQRRHRIFGDGSENQAVVVGFNVARDDLGINRRPGLPSFSRRVSTLSIGTCSGSKPSSSTQPRTALSAGHPGRGCDKLLFSAPWPGRTKISVLLSGLPDGGVQQFGPPFRLGADSDSGFQVQRACRARLLPEMAPGAPMASERLSWPRCPRRATR